jgi:hypothetical protein
MLAPSSSNDQDLHLAPFVAGSSER